MAIRSGLTISFRNIPLNFFSSRSLSFSIILISSLPYSHGFVNELLKEVSVSTLVWGASEREDPDILEAEGLKWCCLRFSLSSAVENWWHRRNFKCGPCLLFWKAPLFRQVTEKQESYFLCFLLLYENHFFKSIFFTEKLKYISLLSQKIPVLNGKNGLQTGNTRQYNTFVLFFTWKVHHYFIFLFVVVLESNLWPLLWWSGCHIRHYLQNQTYWLTFIPFYSHNHLLV